MDVTLTVTKGGSKGKTLQLPSPQTIVGRAADCNLRIPSAAVSRRHCRLEFKDGYLVAEDLDSANGTFVNGAEISRKVVRPGDSLEVGPVTFKVQYTLSPEVEARLLRDAEQATDLLDVEPIELIPEPSDETADSGVVPAPSKKSNKDKRPAGKKKEPQSDRELFAVELDDDGGAGRGNKSKRDNKTKPADQELVAIELDEADSKKDKKPAKGKKPVTDKEEIIAAIEIDDDDLPHSSGDDDNMRDALSKLE